MCRGGPGIVHKPSWVKPAEDVCDRRHNRRDTASASRDRATPSSPSRKRVRRRLGVASTAALAGSVPAAPTGAGRSAPRCTDSPESTTSRPATTGIDASTRSRPRPGRPCWTVGDSGPTDPAVGRGRVAVGTQVGLRYGIDTVARCTPSRLESNASSTPARIQFTSSSTPTRIQFISSSTPVRPQSI